MVKVLLSSTFRDLRCHRKAAVEAIERSGDQPVWMERFGAQSHPPLDECEHHIEQCDVFVLVLGHVYGSVPTVGTRADGKKSFVHLELEHARRVNKPVLVFLASGVRWPHGAGQDGLIEAKTDEEVLRVREEPAYAAGLRDGMELVGVRTSRSRRRPMAVTVRERGVERTVDYPPDGSMVASVRFARVR